MMKEREHTYAARYQGVEADGPSLARYFGISIFFHLIFFGILIFMPDPESRPRFSSGFVNVSLVSLPIPAPAAGNEAATVVRPEKAVKKPPKAEVSKITPPPKAAVVKKQPEKSVSLASKPKEKQSLKKKTIDRPKMIESAVDQIQENVDKSGSESVKAAIDQLKKKVEESESGNPQKYQFSKIAGSNAKSGGSGPSRGSGGSGGGGTPTLEVIKIYQAEIQYQIQKNWAFSQQLAGDSTELEAVLAIKILPSGEIEDIWFDKKSGSSYLDESAYKAIVKSNPLPPLPKEYLGSFYNIGLIFGPKGLK